MEIRRSEVYFVPLSVMTAWVSAALASKDYYSLADWHTAGVLRTDTGEEVCKVRDLIDDRPIPFPPLPEEPSSDTPTDRARDAALREVKRGDT